MSKYVSRSTYDSKCANVLRMYEEAGLTPVDCLSDISYSKGYVKELDGYADGVLTAGVSLLLAGIACKLIGRYASNKESERIASRLAYATQCKNIVDMANNVVPNGDDEDREKNND